MPNAEHQAIAKPEHADAVRKAVGKTKLGGDWWAVYLNFATTDPLKHVVSEIIRTKRQLGIDGIRFDGYPWVWTPECARACGASPDFYNSDGGELCKEEDADDLTLRALQYLKDEVGKAYPDFLWGANGLRWGEAPIIGDSSPRPRGTS